MGAVSPCRPPSARRLLALGLRAGALAARRRAARARVLGARLRGLLGRAAALVRLALAGRRGLLGGLAALARLARATADTTLEVRDEVAQLAHGTLGGVPRRAAVGAPERLGEVARRALAKPARAQGVEQVTIGGPGHWPL